MRTSGRGVGPAGRCAHHVTVPSLPSAAIGDTRASHAPATEAEGSCALPESLLSFGGGLEPIHLNGCPGESILHHLHGVDHATPEG